MDFFQYRDVLVDGHEYEGWLVFIICHTVPTLSWRHTVFSTEKSETVIVRDPEVLIYFRNPWHNQQNVLE